MKRVGILGATGAVGRKLIELIDDHPHFELVYTAASERSVGKVIGAHQIESIIPNPPCEILFSALNAAIAGPIELDYLDRGYTVFTNAKANRYHDQAQLIIPEVNGRKGHSKLVSNPNCCVIGLCIALHPLRRWGLEEVSVSTLQALSGAGASGVAALDISDNVIPFISGEEAKLEMEPKLIFDDPGMKISAHCTRVGVSDGHTLLISIKMNASPSREEIIEAWEGMKGLDLPLSPKNPIAYFEECHFPQPRLHRDQEGGMQVSVGNLRECSLGSWKFTALVHNTIRGAAGSLVLSASL